jgi:hypothetical protein
LLAEALCANPGVIVEVDFQPGGGRNQHWVRLIPHGPELSVAQQTELLATDALLLDPWLEHPVRPRWLMPTYALPAWNSPARAIFRIAIYEPGTQTNSTLRHILQDGLGVYAAH